MAATATTSPAAAAAAVEWVDPAEPDRIPSGPHAFLGPLCFQC